MHMNNPLAEADLRTALSILVLRNRAKWLRINAAILKNREDAEDAFQEAVRRVLAHSRALPSPDHVRMYLGRAIGNTALELYKSRKRERMRQVPIREYIAMPSSIRRPDAWIEEREKSAEKEHQLRLLRQGLRHLPRKQHEALRLLILESRGQSIREVGCANGIPYSTLRHRSKQGLRMLRQYLERGMKQVLRREQ